MGRVRPPRPVELPRRQAIPQRIGSSRELIGARRSPLAIVSVLFVAGCGEGGSPGAAATPCPKQPGVADLGLLPRDIPLDRYANVLEVVVEDDYVNVNALAEDTVVELDPALQRELLDAGYEIIGHDNEGFEAEIFFARDERTLGTFRLREGPCKGHVTVRLIYTSKRIARS